MPFEFESMSAEDISQLLLDYAKGHLSVENCAQIDAAAAKSPAMLEELEYYKGLARAAADGYQAADTSSPGELGWARLSREMDQLERENAAGAAANDNSRLWRYATMALGLVVLGQWALQFTSPASDDDARYIPVSEDLVAISAQITFAPEASEGDIRALLLSADANIIAGPSALGIYRISFADAEARTLGLSKLSESTDIVESAAPQ